MGEIDSLVNKSVQEILNACYDSTNNGLKIAGTINGNLTITGNLAVNGNFTFGDAVTDILTVTGVLQCANGTAAAPSISFAGDPDTGFYWTSANVFNFATNGGVRGGISVNGVAAIGFTAYTPNSSLNLQGYITNGATAIANRMGNISALSTAGAKIVSFYSDALITEKAFIDINGAFSSDLGAATVANGATTFAAQGNVMTVTSDAGGNTIATITAGVVGQRLTLIFMDALCTITDDATKAANTVNLSAAFTSTAEDTLTLIFDGTSWREISRAIN